MAELRDDRLKLFTLKTQSADRPTKQKLQVSKCPVRRSGTSGAVKTGCTDPVGV